jgi:hypothetical protein
VFEALTQNRSSLEPSVGFAAIASTLRIVDHAHPGKPYEALGELRPSFRDKYKPLKSPRGTQNVVAHQAARVRKINGKGIPFSAAA